MLEGEIRDIDLVARLVELWREKFTGAIRFENDGIIKIIYFKEGDVLSASTNDRADSVDEILMKAGKVSREHVKQALAKRKENETLGDTLLNLGFITRKELTWARRVQVVGVIRSINEWPAGSYTIVENYLPKRDEGTMFPLPQIVVELFVTDQDRAKYERELESGSAVFEKSSEFAETFGKLGFNEEAEAVTAEVDGVKTAAEVAAASHQDAFNAYKLLHALSVLGLLNRTGAPAPVVAMPPDLGSLSIDETADAGATSGFEDVGVADAADAWSGPMPKFEVADDTGPGSITSPLGTPPSPPAAPEEPKMPAWDVAPREATPAVAPAAPKPAAVPADDAQWGFDEAQIETARKASVPVAAAATATAPPQPRPAPRRDYSSTASISRRPVLTKPLAKKKKKSSLGLLITVMAIFILAGAGYFGYTWWMGRQAAPATAAVTPRPRPVEPPTTTTAEPATTTVATPTTATFTSPPVATTTHPITRPPVTAPVVPSPPRTTPAGGSDRERYEAMARQFAAAPNAKFTVQFEIVCEPSNVTKALREGGSSVWFIPVSIKGRSCYRVFWGRYQTREAAERAIGEVPASLRETKPAVVTVPQP